jgi:SAM-dependent methyltransferase
MTLIERLFKKAKRTFYRFTLNKEDLFYYNLFVVNPTWSMRQPNEDEQKRWLAIEIFVNEVKRERSLLTILEVGSGRGWLSNLLAKHGSVQGIEPVNIVVKHARKLFPNLQFFAGTTATFKKQFPDNKFDLIVSSEVIEHVPDSHKPNFVRELSTLLTSRGYVILTTPRKEVMTSLPYDPKQPVEDWLTEDETKSLFTANGFVDIGKSTIIASLENFDQELYQVWLFQKVGE